MAIEANGTRVIMVFEQFDCEKRLTQIVGTETQILIKAQRLLAVEMHVEQLTGVECLSKFVIRVEPRHLDVSSLRIYADHFRMIERCNEGQHAANRGQIQIAAG